MPIEPALVKRNVTQHMKIFASVAFALLLAGCATQQSAWEKTEQLMAEPTPAEWTVGSIWSFVQLSEDGSPTLDVTFLITDEPATTCNYGDWRKLELVDGELGYEIVPLEQAYSVSGRLVTIDLTGWCDLGGIQGALTNRWFVGQTTGGPFTFGRFVPQRVVGRMLR